MSKFLKAVFWEKRSEKGMLFFIFSAIYSKYSILMLFIGGKNPLILSLFISRNVFLI